MTAIAWHVTSHLVQDRLITPTTAARRLTARTLLGLPDRYGLLAFSVPDNHLHLLLACDRVTAGRGANKAEGCLVKRLQLSVGFERARLRPVESLRHLENALHYIHRQGEHHGSAGDPLGECNTLWDLLGLRVTGHRCIPRVRAALPRLSRADLLRHALVDDLTPGSTLSLLPQAAAAAIARPDLTGRQPDCRAAKAAAIQIVLQQGLSTSFAGSLLRVPLRSAHRLKRTPVPAPLLKAIRLQLGLREAIGAQSSAA